MDDAGAHTHILTVEHRESSSRPQCHPPRNVTREVSRSRECDHDNETGVIDRPLTAEEIDRYSRQLVVPGMGKQAQLNLLSSRVLVIGAGGLGCAAAPYLAGAGVGTLGIADGDVVETSNLHRQVAHATSRVGTPKAESLAAHLRALNPLPTYEVHARAVDVANAASLVARYDLVLDCTDSPGSRYLISDVCVLLGKPLVSAAAVRTGGQLVVLNCPPARQGVLFDDDDDNDDDGDDDDDDDDDDDKNDKAGEQVRRGARGVNGSESRVGADSADAATKPAPRRRCAPCYRCCFGSRPPPPDSAQTCGEAGILGPVVGVMGVMQAGEVLKILASQLHLPTAERRRRRRQRLRSRTKRETEERSTHASPLDTAASSSSSSLLAPEERNLQPPSLLIYSYELGKAVGPFSFRAPRMAGRKKTCFACGEGSALRLTRDKIESGEIADYGQFCGGGEGGGPGGGRARAQVDGIAGPGRPYLLPPEERISPAAFQRLRESGQLRPGRHVLLDTREREHFSLGCIEGAENMPFGRFLIAAKRVQEEGGIAAESVLPARSREVMYGSTGGGGGDGERDGEQSEGEGRGDDVPIFVVCRRGEDSQEAVQRLKELGLGNGGRRKIMDVAGGMRAWKAAVDPSFPFI